MTETKSLVDALVAIQADAPAITLDSENPHFHSRYPSLAGIMDRVRPVTAKHGIAIVQMPTLVDGQPALTTRLIHAPSGEAIESTMLLLPAREDPQGQGSALTYGRRYMVLSMLGLVGDEDDDANVASEATAGAMPVRTGERTDFASAKQKQFFQRLVKQGGLDSNQVEAVTRFAETLPTDRISAMIDAIRDDSDKAVAALLRLSDEWARGQSDVPIDTADFEPESG